MKLRYWLLIVLVAFAAGILGTLFVPQLFWKASGTVSRPVASSAQQIIPAPSPTTPRLAGRGDPNKAGMQEEYVFSIPRGSTLWLPRVGALRQPSDPQEIRLQAGRAYNIRTSATLPSDVEVSVYSEEQHVLEEAALAPQADLKSRDGFDLYPPRDGVLVMRWVGPTTQEPPVDFHVALLTKSPDERLATRRPIYGRKQ